MAGEHGARAMAGERGAPSSGTAPVNRTTLRLPHDRSLPLIDTPLVMGIINSTPDSFSDGGVHFDPGVAIDSGLQMVDDGADLIDIGGESTRPGAEPVPVDEELRRVIPVIEGIRSACNVTISIDTTKAEVAEAALSVGADMVNDVSALRFDPRMVAVVREGGGPVILMHMRGVPRTMQQNVDYDNLIGDIGAELREWRDEAVRQGVDRDQILVDPGIGFGKTFEDNVEILANAKSFASIGPVVIGASRKGFIGSLTHRGPGPDRAAGSLGAVAAAALGGAAIVRVHDVRGTIDFLKVLKPTLEVRAR